MSERKMRKLVAAIPGENGWWHSGGADTYQELATKLRAYGIPADEVVDILTAAYHAAAEEFGS